MQFTIQDFPENERYFLMELSYFDFPDIDLGDVSFSKPLSLSYFVETLEQAENAARRFISDYEFYKEKAIHRLRMIFQMSPYLQGMKMVGCINDNRNVYGTTKNMFKSGLAAQAYADQEGNVMLVYRGFESSSILAGICDYGTQLLTYFGIASPQFKRARQFFKEIAAEARGRIIIAGDRLGGSMAMYTYIKEKESFPLLTGIASNGKKRALLWKELRVGKYITTEDFIFKRSVKKEIQNAIMEKMFRDMDTAKRQEKSSFYDETEQYFRSGQEYYKVLFPVLKMLKEYVKADSMSLWFRHEDKGGEYIIPYLVDGEVLPGLQNLKLREGETFITASVFLGIGKQFPDLKRSRMFSYVQSLGGHESMICVPVSCDGKPIGALHLSKIGENWKFDEGAYGQVISFVERLGSYLSPYKNEIFYDDYFFQIYNRDMQKPVFFLEEFENRKMKFAKKDAFEDVISCIKGERLTLGEVLKYDGVCYTAENIEEYQNKLEEDMETLFEQEFDVSDSLSSLMEPYCEKEKEDGFLEKLDSRLHFKSFQEKVFEALTVKEKLIFHTVMCFIRRPKFLIVYPYLYALDKRLAEWAEDVIRRLSEEQRVTVLQFVVEE